MNLKEFKKLPVIGIIRGISSSYLEPLIETTINAGLKTLEITMNTDNAAALVKEAVKISSGRIDIGAGTILKMDQLGKALDSGASFIITPVLIEEVTKYCLKNKIPVFPGALTPAEIYRAWDAGATMVKVFPASSFGPVYFREVKGPFNNIELMAVGGVTIENIHQYLSSGADAIAFGSGVFRKEWIQKKDFSSIREIICRYIKEVKDFLNPRNSH